ncbi:PadR family transcriptional regulator [Priestia aryabhattai]|uniref:Lineage-specific thermal regulator protein n=3 Tax=Priestia TaxID=2800373 RepID=A0A806TJ91_PRIMG|nr:MULTISPECIES: PadR family transcriptional regulator [Priestia]AEN88735.1 Transcriptional regulator, PadR-like family [Priestia megaterium WSH-002]AKP78381.1 lineage-specific thermal regulator protein [Priestia megaterium Q3]MCM2975449.1 PadR family transcriptional regulator [Priestia aryabhattai]MDN3363497.1 PadR family transcriptional regulator [Priestia megaterium]MDU9691687.1 PadR family transcriptional regulator [Priestia aryabhattai]
MPRNDSLETGELTDTSYYILVSLLEAKHGYLIMKTIEDMTNQQFSIGPASMYTTIKKLLAAELIMLYGESKDKKKTYVATEKGIQFLKKEIQRRKEMIKHAEDILGGL